MAMKMGKHCFTQKPMTKTIEESRVMGELAKEKKLATQMGNQGTAGNTLREAAAVIKSGASLGVTIECKGDGVDRAGVHPAASSARGAPALYAGR